MATELEIRKQLDTMRSLPPRLERLVSLLGTVDWPGQKTRMNFPSGMELSEPERAELETTKLALSQIISGENLTTNESSKARLSLLTKMLLAFPAAGSTSEKAADARLDMYDEAVSDIAPWAIHAAIKRWARGEVPPAVRNPNFSFAPSPADLRNVCMDELSAFTGQIDKIDRLLSAVTIERAMDPKPIERAQITSASGQGVVGMLRRM